MRIAEIMNDFRNIQHCIASIRANPSAEEYNEEGYVVLRRCVAAAQALLSHPFQQPGSRVTEDDEPDRTNLRRSVPTCSLSKPTWESLPDKSGSIITDAAVRRFQAQKLYLQITAALRWMNARAAILQGQRPHAGHAPALQQVRSALRAVRLHMSTARIASADMGAVGTRVHHRPARGTLAPDARFSAGQVAGGGSVVVGAATAVRVSAFFFLFAACGRQQCVCMLMRWVSKSAAHSS
ncbi:hypothetical protein Tdes44962_MAKER08998 [Teratosphaeria destructans]|uniref:Uncharacterized protein n=1 Tax=Teratosphaeria destructans TaxID=418781 RepID=A0A9W7SUA1_9PEZI|nr:hypothetical protein Tdes44962_MAKER08998 [Teratosphaeria destructans]